MKELMLGHHPVRVNDRNLINLNDMHQASGSRRAKEPSKFMRMKDTREYIAELNTQNLGHFQSLRGSKGGTWVCKYIAYKYASWIDKKFEVGVMKTLDAYFSGDLKTEKQWLMQQELQQFAYDEGRSKEKGTIGSKLMLGRKKEKHVLERQAIILLKKYQYELELKPAELPDQ